MNRPERVASCVAPGSQPVLFRLPSVSAPQTPVIASAAGFQYRTTPSSSSRTTPSAT